MTLTKDEITLLAVVFLALVGGAMVKHYRATHRDVNTLSKPAAEKAAPEL